jgi:hypothetical protein
MNRFLELVDDLKQRANSDDKLAKLLQDVDRIVKSSGDLPVEKGFRLPYSSNPKWIDERWK